LAAAASIAVRISSEVSHVKDAGASSGPSAL
jgi:hypothetical protein